MQPVSAATPSAALRVDTFDGLRGAAIAVVVWYHLWLVTGVPTTLLAQTGFMGVDLFFFVSGFCLFHPYARHVFEGRPAPTVGQFAERRLEKILPSYFLALGVLTVAHATWFTSVSDLGWNLIAHALFIHPLWWNTFGSISGPFWTLGIEVQFYALFPFIVWHFRRHPIPVFVCMLGVAQAYRLIAAHLGIDGSLWGVDQLPAVLDVFGAGMLAAYTIGYLGARGGESSGRHWIWSLGGGVAIAALIALLTGLRGAAMTDGPEGQYTWLNAHRWAFALSFLALSVCCHAGLPAVRKVLGNPVLLFGAAISYNLYLWHLEIIVWLSGLHVPALFAAVCAVVVAWLLTISLERPLLRGGWRRAFAWPLFARSAGRTAVTTANP